MDRGTVFGAMRATTLAALCAGAFVTLTGCGKPGDAAPAKAGGEKACGDKQCGGDKKCGGAKSCGGDRK